MRDRGMIGPPETPSPAPVTQTPKPTASDGLGPLRAAIDAAARPYFVVGELPLANTITMTILPDNPERPIEAVKFPPASPNDLEVLVKACSQASFGRGKEDVIDSEYRQALVLSADRFGIIPQSSVDPVVQAIVPAIQQALYPSTEFGGVSQRRIVAELDKLNVYGVGDFFKGHVDTPRSGEMFGTLLLNLPVKHAGGELVVYAPTGHGKENEKYTTTWGNDTSISWIAFFSDCAHEVLPVTSGNRCVVRSVWAGQTRALT